MVSPGAVHGWVAQSTFCLWFPIQFVLLPHARILAGAGFKIIFLAILILTNLYPIQIYM